MFIRLDVGRALKQHVFEEMREAGAALAFIGAADVVPEIHGHQRGDMILGIRDAEAVGERFGVDWYLHMREKIPPRDAEASRDGSGSCAAPEWTAWSASVLQSDRNGALSSHL